MTKLDDKCLVGNSFPWTLVRRRIDAVPVSVDQFRREAAVAGTVSFWGHPDSLADASEFCGIDLTPSCERPVLVLSPEGLPMLNGETFRRCYLISPEYGAAFRMPLIPGDVAPPPITAWRILRIDWA